jgi:regulator of protease activity HflC (stomatin/prohibitin superfamily)
MTTELLLPTGHQTGQPIGLPPPSAPNIFGNDSKARPQEKTEEILSAHKIRFTDKIGDFPLAEGNCHSQEDVLTNINAGHSFDTGLCTFSSWCCGLFTCGLGVCCRQALIDQGEYGFVVDELHGKFAVLQPGRHFLRCGLSLAKVVKMSELTITLGSTSIVRVETGKFGLAHSDGKPLILMPGLHAHNDGNWVFVKCVNSDSDWTFPPLTVFTVQPGTFCWAYVSGKISIFTQGRYFVNDTAFKLQPAVSLARQQINFSPQVVTLDRAVQLNVKSSAIFQVHNPDKWIQSGLTFGDLTNQMDVVCRNQLSALFAKITFDQLSSTASLVANPNTGMDTKHSQLALTGSVNAQSNELTLQKMSGPGVTTQVINRDELCGKVQEVLQHEYADCGIAIKQVSLNWALADMKFANDYEQAGLSLAATRVKQAAVEAENAVALRKAQNAATIQQVEADGFKISQKLRAEAESYAKVIRAEGEAKAIGVITEAKNKGASSMTDFAKELALAEIRVRETAAFQPGNGTIIVGATDSSIINAILRRNSAVVGPPASVKK